MTAHVDIVYMHDAGYWSIFVNGQYFGTTHKEYFTDTVFRSSCRAEMSDMANVPTDDLRFTVYSDFFEKVYKATGGNYDCNDFLEDHATIMQLISQHGITPDGFGNNVTLETLEMHY